MAVATTYDVPSLIGDLTLVGGQIDKAPLFRMMNVLRNGGSVAERVKPGSKDFVMTNTLAEANGDKDAWLLSETTSMAGLTAGFVQPTQLENSLAIMGTAVGLSDVALALKDVLSGLSLDARGKPVSNFAELKKQMDSVIRQVPRNINAQFWHSTRVVDNVAATVTETNGVATALIADDNTVEDAAGAVVTETMFRNVIQKLDAYTNIVDPVIFCNRANQYHLEDLFMYAPTSRTIGGVEMDQLVITGLGSVPIVYENELTTEIAILDMARMEPAWAPWANGKILWWKPIVSEGLVKQVNLQYMVGLNYVTPTSHALIKDTKIT